MADRCYITRMKRMFLALVFASICCPAAAQWNNPHQTNSQENIRYGAFTGPPKTLDPAKSYSSDETLFIAQIYEPPLQYDYLKRPVELVPLAAAKMPTVTYYNTKGQKLPENVDPKKIAYSLYDIEIKPGMYYQPHPALAKDEKGEYRYHHLSAKDLAPIYSLNDFKYQGTREVTADDFAYEIKRLASPALQSPIFGLMSDYIVGFPEYGKTLQNAYKKLPDKNAFLDLRNYPLEGVKVIDRYHYQIKIKGIYSQFKYWLAMPFFAPIPWEADYFYSQPGMKEKNITLDWFPIGSGPYLLAENNPNKQMVLERNPNFHGEKYPSVGEPGDKEKGYLEDAGKPMPFVDKFIFSLDKESIPRWYKFLQGYYDKSGVSADSFDQAIRFDANGKPIVSPELQKKGIQLQTSISPSLFYIGFNMQDDVVGGYGEKQKKLRQAIAIAVDYEEFISIFLNGRGVPAQGPIPPGIFGYEKKDFNPVVYYDDHGKIKRKPLAFAKKLMVEAGYPNGIDPKTGRALILNYDAASSGNPDDQALFNWLRKQFAKLGIQLNIRATQYNTFQDKIRRGNAQIFSWGWNADYPDPENFLFLLYGPNGIVKSGGENASNYSNPKVNALFDQIKNMPNGPERQAKITELLKIVREDSPWLFGFHPIDFVLSHSWNRPSKPNPIANNLLKYERLNPKERDQKREEWNKPTLWPIWIIVGIMALMLVPLVITFWRRENRSSVKRE